MLTNKKLELCQWFVRIYRAFILQFSTVTKINRKTYISTHRKIEKKELQHVQLKEIIFLFFNYIFKTNK